MSIVKPNKPPTFKGQNKPKKSERRFVDEDHLAFVRTLPCTTFGGPCSGQVESHHIMVLPDNSRGGAMKAGDQWTIPLCHTHHMRLHETGEQSFLAGWGIHGPALAALLFVLSGNEDACIRAVAEMKG